MRHSKTSFSIIFLSALVLIFTLMTPLQAQDAPDWQAACFDEGVLPPRLAGGMMARVVADEPVNVRAEASTQYDIVAKLQPGQIVFVTSAPTCNEGYIWWQVLYTNQYTYQDFPFGYAVEGADGEYWLEPYLQTMGIPQNRTTITPENAASLQQAARAGYGLVSGDVVWSDDGRYMAVNSVGSVWVYDTTTPGEAPLWLNPNPVSTNSTNNIVFAPEQNIVALTGGPDGRYTTWSLTDGALLDSFNPQAGEYQVWAALSPDLTKMAVGLPDSSIALWDIPSQNQIAQLSGHTIVGPMRFTSDSSKLVSVGAVGMMGSDNTAHIWDAATGEELAAYEGAKISILAPDDRTLNVSLDDGSVQIIDIETVETRFTLSADNAGTVPGSAAYLSPDGTQAAYIQSKFVTETVSWENTLLLIDLASGTVTTTISYQGFGKGAYSPDGKLFAVMNGVQVSERSYDYSIILVDTTTGEIAAEHPVPGNIQSMSFSPDGTMLAVNYEDTEFWGPNNVTLWAIP